MNKRDEQADLVDSLITDHNEASSSSSSDNAHTETPLEKLIRKVGGEHKYQWISFVLFGLLWFFTSWLLVGQSFFFDNSFTCFDEHKPEQCSKFICGLPKSERPHAMKSHADSIVFAFEGKWMICENDYIRPILTSMVYIGSLIGFFIISFISDNWGRRPAIRLAWAIFGVGVLCLCFCNSPFLVGMGFLLSGVGCNPAITLGYSFLNEQCLGHSRQYFSVGIQVFLAVGQCVIGLLFLPDYSWRVVFYMLLGCIVAVQIMLEYLVQSPKFLISRSKAKALQALNSIAKKNGKQPLSMKEVEDLDVSEDSGEKSSFIDLFRYKSLRWVSIGAGIVFMSIQIIYYGTSLNLDKAGFSMLKNQEIIGISEGLAYLAAELIINKVKRKKASIIGMGISSFMCFFLGIFTSLQNEHNKHTFQLIETFGLVLNRFILCAFWGLFYVYVAELYPTRVRSMGMGWVSAVGTVGSTMASYLIFFSEKIGIDSWFPPGIFGLFGVAAIFLLKETFGKTMRDEIEQVEEGKGRKIKTEEETFSNTQQS